MSLASVSFASEESTYTFSRIGDAPLHYDAAEYYSQYGDHLMMNNGFNSYAAAAYYPIIFDGPDGEFIASDIDLVDSLKVKASFTQGANLVGKVEIVKMNVGSTVDTMYPVTGGRVFSADLQLLGESGAGYYYFVKIPVNPYFTTGEDQNMVARVSSRSTVKPDTDIKVGVDTSRVHIFDKDTERCIIH